MLLGMKSHFSLIGCHYPAQRLCHSKELLPESVCAVVTRRYFVVCQQIGRLSSTQPYLGASGGRNALEYVGALLRCGARGIEFAPFLN
jgi:hypothetical protein